MLEDMLKSSTPLPTSRSGRRQGPFTSLLDGFIEGMALKDAMTARSKRKGIERAAAQSVKVDETTGKKSFDPDAFQQSLLDQGMGLEAYRAQVETETQEAIRAEADFKKRYHRLNNMRMGLQLAQAGDRSQALEILNQGVPVGERTTEVQVLKDNKVRIVTEDEGEKVYGMNYLIKLLADIDTQFAQEQDWLRFHLKLASDYNQDATPTVLLGRAMRKQMFAERLRMEKGMPEEKANTIAEYQPFEQKMVTKYMEENTNLADFMVPIFRDVSAGKPLNEMQWNVVELYSKIQNAPLNELLGNELAKQREDMLSNRLRRGVKGPEGPTPEESKFLEDFRKTYPKYKDKSDEDILKRAREQKLLK